MSGAVCLLAELESGLDDIESAFEATDWPADGETADWQTDDAGSWVEANFAGSAIQLPAAY